MSTATMTSKNQITVPRDVREDLGLEPGIKLDFVRVGPREYRVRPRTTSVMDLAGIARYDGPALSIEEMNEGIRDAWAGIGRE